MKGSPTKQLLPMPFLHEVSFQFVNERSERYCEVAVCVLSTYFISIAYASFIALWPSASKFTVCGRDEVEASNCEF